MSIPKSLIIDTNILFSFFKSDSARRHLIKELLNKEIKLISPDFTFEELLNNKEKIIKFSEISKEEFKFLFALLKKNIVLFPKEKYNNLLHKASSLSPHTKDDPYFALALKLNFPIWADEKSFKQQDKIKIFSTNEISTQLSKL